MRMRRMLCCDDDGGGESKEIQNHPIFVVVG